MESLLCCFGTSCHCGQSLDELFSLCDPIRRHIGKGKKEMLFRAKKVLHPVLFLSCGHCTAQGLDEVFMCMFQTLAL